MIEQYSLPSVREINFEDESEVTIFSSIFPNNIFYVHDLVNDIYVFNPYLLQTEIKDIVASNINVDQSCFDENLKGIYSRSVWRRGEQLIFESEAI